MTRAIEPALIAASRSASRIGGALALALFALLRILHRGGPDRAVTGAACGGIAANPALQLHCPITAPEHMVVGHLGVATFLVTAVAVYGRVRVEMLTHALRRRD